MFTAIGVGVSKAGVRYDVKVDYFDDRVVPMSKVATIVHNVVTQPELATAVQAQLLALKNADQLSALNTAITGKTLGTI